MNNQHSPGPWKVQPMLDNFHGYEDWTTANVRDARNCHVATIGEVDRLTGKETKANARLIASAPELLEALQSIAGWSKCQCSEKHGDNPNCPVLIAERAVRKATEGE